MQSYTIKLENQIYQIKQQENRYNHDLKNYQDLIDRIEQQGEVIRKQKEESLKYLKNVD